MIGFVEGTLLLSNILLILLSVIYGILIIKKKKYEESNLWLFFMIACGLFFISELLDFLQEYLPINVGIIKSILRISFGTTILFAFLTKYDKLNEKK